MGWYPYLSSIQSAYAVLYCCPWLFRPYIFPRHPINGMIFGKVVTGSKTSVLNFSKTFFFCIISRSKKNPARYYHKCTQVPVIIVRFLSALNFRHTFEKNAQKSSLTKIREVRAELFYAARRRTTSTTKLTVALSNCVNAPENTGPLHAVAIQLHTTEGNINPLDNKINLNYI
jgi:hypothetical protein